MKITLICALKAPHDDRFSASGIVTFDYLADEPESVIRSDAKSIADRGMSAVTELVEEGILRATSRIDVGCVVPERWPVTVNFGGCGGRFQTVKPS